MAVPYSADNIDRHGNATVNNHTQNLINPFSLDVISNGYLLKTLQCWTPDIKPIFSTIITSIFNIQNTRGNVRMSNSNTIIHVTLAIYRHYRPILKLPRYRDSDDSFVTINRDCATKFGIPNQVSKSTNVRFSHVSNISWQIVPVKDHKGISYYFARNQNSQQNLPDNGRWTHLWLKPFMPPQEDII